MQGGSVSELVGAVVVVGALDVIGLLSELGLLALVVPRLLEFELPSPVGLVDMPGPRGRIGPPRARGLPAPIGLPKPDGLRNDVVPDDTLVESDEDDVDEGGETDETEPNGAVGEQLTPGVMIGDGLWDLADLAGAVGVDVDDVADVDDVGDAVVEPVPVVPLFPAVCANAGAALRAIAHARPAPPRIGIFRILTEMFFRLLVKMILLPMFTRIDASNLPVSPLRPRSVTLQPAHHPIH